MSDIQRDSSNNLLLSLFFMRKFARTLFSSSFWKLNQHVYIVRITTLCSLNINVWMESPVTLFQAGTSPLATFRQNSNEYSTHFWCCRISTRLNLLIHEDRQTAKMNYYWSHIAVRRSETIVKQYSTAAVLKCFELIYLLSLTKIQ